MHSYDNSVVQYVKAQREEPVTRMIDHGAPDPPYVQAANDLRARITGGEFTTGRLTPVRKLAREYGISQVTIQRALLILKTEGLIYGVPPQGMFIGTRQ
jgi:GntR family transcriptional regulator